MHGRGLEPLTTVLCNHMEKGLEHLTAKLVSDHQQALPLSRVRKRTCAHKSYSIVARSTGRRAPTDLLALGLAALPLCRPRHTLGPRSSAAAFPVQRAPASPTQVRRAWRPRLRARPRSPIAPPRGTIARAVIDSRTSARGRSPRSPRRRARSSLRVGLGVAGAAAVLCSRAVGTVCGGRAWSGGGCGRGRRVGGGAGGVGRPPGQLAELHQAVQARLHAVHGLRRCSL